MSKLDRSQWYDVARDTCWTPTYVKQEELFPDEMCGAMGVPFESWTSYDEPYKQTYPEYVKVQREKDAGAYSIRAASRPGTIPAESITTLHQRPCEGRCNMVSCEVTSGLHRHWGTNHY